MLASSAIASSMMVLVDRKLCSPLADVAIQGAMYTSQSSAPPPDLIAVAARIHTASRRPPVNWKPVHPGPGEGYRPSGPGSVQRAPPGSSASGSGTYAAVPPGHVAAASAHCQWQTTASEAVVTSPSGATHAGLSGGLTPLALHDTDAAAHSLQGGASSPGLLSPGFTGTPSGGAGTGTCSNDTPSGLHRHGESESDDVRVDNGIASILGATPLSIPCLTPGTPAALAAPQAVTTGRLGSSVRVGSSSSTAVRALAPLAPPLAPMTPNSFQLAQARAALTQEASTLPLPSPSPPTTGSTCSSNCRCQCVPAVEQVL
jgi:hypothetical protein